MKILHVTEAFGGGVTSAINLYVSNSQNFEHYLVASMRSEDATGEETEGLFAGVYVLPRRLFAIVSIFRVYWQLMPDVVHVHSSYAGFIVRVLPIIPGKKIIYTPHGYSFLRDGTLFKKRLLYIVERILSKRTRVIAACGKHELLLAQEFLPSSRTLELVNVAADLYVARNLDEKGKLVVAMVGRISAQKGWDFFVEVVKRASTDVEFLWIGGGDPVGVDALRQHGVKVTGWIERQEVLSLLSQVDIYLHTAAWDGFPISVLEAARMKIPLILRSIGSFVAEGLHVVTTPGDAAVLIDSCFGEDKQALEEMRNNTVQINAYHTIPKLQSSLEILYLTVGSHR
jgi:glycosyltransferase involved in cell wall biosynthesis